MEKQNNEKGLVEAATSTSPIVESSSSLQDYSTTKHSALSIDTKLSETQIFRADGIYKQCYEKEKKGKHWTFIVYEDSAPKDWMEQLAETGLAFVISPYHNKDKNPDDSPKKPHWHVIVSYPNSTTYNNVCGLRSITRGPYPMAVGSVGGLYAYLTHKHNPEKYQYDTNQIQRFNGWEKTLESTEVSAIKQELTEMILLEEITEYAELIATVMFMDGDYQSVAMNNTVYFDRLCSSYRYNKHGTLMRFYDNAPDGELKQRIYDVLNSSDFTADDTAERESEVE